MEDYLDLLEESLVKKSAILDKIEEFNLKQRDIFSGTGDNPDFDRFDSYVEEKGKLINELNALDNGFETLYERVADTLKENKKENTGRIARLQDLIREITDKSSSLQSQERTNRELMEDYFQNAREQIGKGRNSLNAAFNYFQTQRGVGGTESYYVDSKQ